MTPFIRGMHPSKFFSTFENDAEYIEWLSDVQFCVARIALRVFSGAALTTEIPGPDANEIL